MRTRFELTVIQPVISACNENWDTMLPHEKGAFCNSCNKVVNDLSALNADELAGFLVKNKDNAICGRVRSDLMTRMVPILEKQPHRYSFNFLFVFALFLSFGPLLFSCNEDEYELATTTITEVLSKLPQEEIPLNEEIITDTPVTLSYSECTCLDGEFIEEVAPPPAEEVITDTSEQMLDPVYVTASSRTLISGAISYTTIRYSTYLEIDTTAVEHIIAKTPKSLPLLVYPNPATDQITINYDIAEEGMALLSVFTINGQKITDVISRSDASLGSFSETMDVSNLPAGMYIVILLNNNKKEVFRLSVVH